MKSIKKVLGKKMIIGDGAVINQKIADDLGAYYSRDGMGMVSKLKELNG